MSSKPAGLSRPIKMRKAAGIQRLFLGFSLGSEGCGRPARLQPLAPTAAVPARTVVPVPISTHHAVLEAAVHPAAFAPVFAVMGQDGQPAFLAVVQGLVE